MKMSSQFNAVISLAAFIVAVAVPNLSAQAADVAASGIAAKTPIRAASAAVQVQPKVAGKVETVGGAVVGKQGDNQYPSGTIPTPPKPKKELLEGAAIKTNVAKP